MPVHLSEATVAGRAAVSGGGGSGSNASGVPTEPVHSVTEVAPRYRTAAAIHASCVATPLPTIVNAFTGCGGLCRSIKLGNLPQERAQHMSSDGCRILHDWKRGT